MTNKVLNPTSSFTLTPPEPIAVPTEDEALATIVELPEAQRAQVDSKLVERVEDFVRRVNTAQLRSDAFREMLDRAFNVGLREVTDTSNYMSANPIMDNARFRDYAGTEGAKAMDELAGIMSKADPKSVDLVGAVKVWGVPVPFTSKLRAFLADRKSMSKRVTELMEIFEKDEDAQDKQILQFDLLEKGYFAKLMVLDRATEYLRLLSERLNDEVQALMTSNPEKAAAVRDEVLYYVAKNLRRVGKQKVLVAAAIGQIGQLRHTGRMTKDAVSEQRTLGKDAMEMLMTIEIATYEQKQRMDRARLAGEAVNHVVSAVGDAVAKHVDTAIEFESNPTLKIDTLAASVDKIVASTQKYNEFRATALQTIQADVVKVDAHFDRAKDALRIEQRSGSERAGEKYGDVFSI
jgi:uncharacterized protein YaaN involved in tellurite resistance